MLLTIMLLVVGLGLLVKGSGWLVDSAAGIAKRFGISEFIIGITIVAIGTSLPELATSVYAALIGSADIAVGNVIGSNITNIALIVGVCALIRTIKFSWQIAKRDLVLIIGSAFVCFPIMISGSISRFAGLLLVLIFSAYIADLLLEYKRNYRLRDHKRTKLNLKEIAFVIVGCGAVLLGAKLTIDSAATLAAAFGITHRVIGLTLVAIGTSLPELATSIVATIKGKGGMVIGNIAGSNAFNILGVLGIAAIARPLPINPLTLTIDLPIMLIVSLFFLFIWDRDVSRFEGLVLFSFYLTFLAVIFA